MATNRVEIGRITNAYQPESEIARIRAIIETARKCRRVVEVDVSFKEIVFRANWHVGKKPKAK